MARHRLGLIAVTLLIGLLSGGCSYSNVTTPLAWRASTPAEVLTAGEAGELPEVRGEACNQVLFWLVAFGDAGYDAALTDALGHAGGAVTLSDVKADTTSLSVLGLFQRHCTVVRGRPVRLEGMPLDD